MALEAVVFPHDQLWHSINNGGIPWGAYEFDPALIYYTGGLEMPAGAAQELPAQGARHRSCTSHLVEDIEKWEVNSSPEADVDANDVGRQTLAGGGRRKRRRAKACKNKEEVENQRMTHIAVERNRRKQMNEYLAVLRSLMPPSYVQRGDQASIVGGAINFVRELEQLLQYLEAQKRLADAASGGGFSASLFAHVFTFPQYSTSSSSGMVSTGKAIAENRSAIADIEVTMVESHANLKVLSRRRPRQLLKMAVGLQSFRLTILHLNVTTVEQMVLYSFSIKVEDDCILSSADEIAAAVHQMLVEILGEIGLN